MTHTTHSHHGQEEQEAIQPIPDNAGTAPAQDRYSAYALPASIVIAAFIIGGTLLYMRGNTIKPIAKPAAPAQQARASVVNEDVTPSQGVELPATWGDLGKKLVDAGAIDKTRFEALYRQRGGFSKEYEDLLTGESNGKLVINNENSGYILNLLWAFGLANKNPILEKGEMTNPQFGGLQNFASTGGWTMAKGNAMDHYSAHALVAFTPEQQELVERVSKTIYRPCCDNSTHFPDCNHGMAMLGLLELMASQGASEQDMYRAALAANSYWFPNNYITVAAYMKQEGVSWKDVDPRQILGREYSSSSGFRAISSRVAPQPQQQGAGSGCAVGGAAPVPQQQQGTGCGI
jgi:hypothetical protein